MTIDLEMIGKDLNFKTEAPNDEELQRVLLFWMQLPI